MIGKSILASIVVNGITEYQQALSAWERRTVVNPLEVSPGPRDTHYVVVQLEDEPIQLTLVKFIF
jgi:hypothetical protein